MKKKIFLILITLLLCASVSYSWILDSVREPPASWLGLDLQGREYGKNLFIQSDNGFSIQVLKYIDAYTEIPVDSEHPLEFNNMIPGQSLRFKIRLRNFGGNTNAVKIFMSDLTCNYVGSGACDNPQEILDNMYLIVYPGVGYVNSQDINAVKPDMIYSTLSDLMTAASNSTVVLYTDLKIPQTPEINDYVELECRFWFDVKAEELNDISLSIGKIVLIL